MFIIWSLKYTLNTMSYLLDMSNCKHGNESNVLRSWYIKLCFTQDSNPGHYKPMCTLFGPVLVGLTDVAGCEQEESWAVWPILMFEGVTDLKVGHGEKLCVGLKQEFNSQAYSTLFPVEIFDLKIYFMKENFFHI